MKRGGPDDRLQVEASDTHKRSRAEPSAGADASPAPATATATAGPSSRPEQPSAKARSPSPSYLFNLSVPRPAGQGQAPAYSRVYLRAPQRLTSYSFDGERKLLLNDSAQKYFKDPPAGVDLGYGFSKAKWREPKIEHLDTLLTSLQSACPADRHAASSGAASDIHRTLTDGTPSLITWRGMMTKLCTAPYEAASAFPSAWEMDVMLVDKTMYIDEHVSKARYDAQRAEQTDERRRLFSYYGYAFESYCVWPNARTLPEIGAPTAWSGNVNTNEQWCEVMKTGMDTKGNGGSTRVLLGGETDCLIEPGREEARARARRDRRAMELKTNMQIRHEGDAIKFEKKMLRIYMQAFLLGVDHVVVGFRDSRGRLVSHQQFLTANMPQLVRGKPHAWDPHLCTSFAYDALAWIRKSIESDSRTKNRDALPVWRLSFEAPFERFTLRRLRKGEYAKELDEGRTEGRERWRDVQRMGFLPVEHLEWREAMAREQE
ncbi:Nuclear 5'-3' exoribonuclease-interacting protein, Rai1p [Ceraceosorus bombacis]|uniref:Decapping nuclease n=1 Tax=Ceraceosorus bombacis TaxID=401625 RepID=A0A0P1BBC2_9BASI|nr:Nuclear 5'-3' exoribonuclease-interacting protein, Rai1p [Ceraceosorus bombacis]